MTTRWLFPDLLPEELFVSACARYRERLNYGSLRGLNEDLFGRRIVVIASDLPAYLDHFVGQLPPAGRPTADALIDAHTQLPYYAPFTSPAPLAAARRDMRGNEASSVHAHLGLSVSSVEIPSLLRLCPDCVVADRQLFEETYWHRVHQLPGVLLCPEHATMLRVTGVSARQGRGRIVCRSAESVVRDDTSAQSQEGAMGIRKEWHTHLLAIARDSAWLLAQRGLCPSMESFRPRYQTLLNRRGFASHRGDVDWPSLLAAFRAYYPEELLALLHSQVPVGGDQHWLVPLVRKPGNLTIGEPLHHLVLLHFLGYSAADFFALPAERRFFVTGPWPCLNPVGGHHGEPCVTRCAIDFTDGSTPRGTFACDDCGYAYYRHGPDRGEEARYEKLRVRAYGPVWQAKLREMWGDPAMQLQQMARVLGVQDRTVKRQAKELGLAPVRPMRGRGRPVTPLPERGEAPYNEVRTLLPRYKAVWLEARGEHPDWSLTQLREVASQPYLYLRRHDHSWLRENLPPIRRCRVASPSRIDWSARDDELAALVDAAAQMLLNRNEPPARLSRSAVCAATKRYGIIVGNLWRLPKTAATLAQYTSPKRTSE